MRRLRGYGGRVTDLRRERRWRDLVVDCERPAPLARFWAGVLRWDPPVWTEQDLADLAEVGIDDVERDPTVFILDPDPTRPRICFQRVDGTKTGKNRLHLDVNVDDTDEIQEFTRRGARVLADHGGWVVLADPEGNEFCAVLD